MNILNLIHDYFTGTIPISRFYFIIAGLIIYSIFLLGSRLIDIKRHDSAMKSDMQPNILHLIVVRYSPYGDAHTMKLYELMCHGYAFITYDAYAAILDSIDSVSTVSATVWDFNKNVWTQICVDVSSTPVHVDVVECWSDEYCNYMTGTSITNAIVVKREPSEFHWLSSLIKSTEDRLKEQGLIGNTTRFGGVPGRHLNHIENIFGCFTRNIKYAGIIPVN